MESYISRCCSMASGLKLFYCSLTVTVVQVHVDGSIKRKYQIKVLCEDVLSC